MGYKKKIYAFYYQHKKHIAFLKLSNFDRVLNGVRKQVKQKYNKNNSIL